LLIRAIVAVVFHRPGLWLFYGIRVPVHVQRMNRVAIAAVMLAMAGSAIFVRPQLRVMAVLIAWALGHILWGFYLAFVVCWKFTVDERGFSPTAKPGSHC
jgi:hypothetical protein